MRLPEQKLWDRMRTHLSTYKIKLWRVENIMVAGMPDVLSLCFGITTWIELKEAQDFPARPTTPLIGEKKGLSNEQRNWHIDHHREGGRSLIVVGVGPDELFTVPGALADEVNSMSADAFRAASVASSWGALAKILGAEAR